LNIKENSSLHNKYNYDDKICSIEFLNLFTKALKTSKLLDYFIINLSNYCLKFKISTYLTDFIKNCFIKVSKKPIHNSTDAFIYSSYINNMIKSTKDFDLTLNLEINNLIDEYHGKYLTLSNGDDRSKIISNNFLIGLTQTICCLYNEESPFYDENNILQKLLEKLQNAIEYDQLLCKVCLTCIAYKSNLVDNLEVNSTYDYIKKVTFTRNVKKILTKILILSMIRQTNF
jgi:hypothetical protein